MRNGLRRANACSEDFARCMSAVRFVQWRDVSALPATQEGRQAPRVLEHRRVAPRQRWARRAAPSSVPGRDQRQPARSLAQDHRSAGCGPAPPSGPVPRGLHALRRRRCHRCAPERAASCASAPVGCVLAGPATVAATRTGFVLASPPAPLARGHAVAEVAQGAGGLPALRPGLRVAAAPPVLRCQCHGRSVGVGLWLGREEHPVPLLGQTRGAQGRALQVPAAALG